jgi:hypothetical protein
LRLICLWLSFMGFLHVWCFRFNDMAHMFEKLTRVDILFLADFLFRFHCWTLFFFKKNGFMVFFNFFSIELSRFHGLGHGFYGLTWVGLPLIIQVICLAHYLRLIHTIFYLILCIQRFVFQVILIFFWKKIIIFLLLLPFLYFLETIKSTYWIQSGL